MLALTLIVGFSLLVPVNRFTDYSNFYAVCAGAEILWALLALRLRTQASYFIVAMCTMLVAYHLNGWYFGGYQHQSPYRVLVKICEYAEILACCLFSNPILRLLKKNATRLHH